jgi:hypothetical protein
VSISLLPSKPPLAITTEPAPSLRDRDAAADGHAEAAAGVAVRERLLEVGHLDAVLVEEVERRADLPLERAAVVEIGETARERLHQTDELGVEAPVPGHAEPRARVPHRAIDIGGAGERHAAPGLLGVGVDAGKRLAGLGRDPLAVDEHPELAIDVLRRAAVGARLVTRLGLRCSRGLGHGRDPLSPSDP